MKKVNLRHNSKALVGVLQKNRKATVVTALLVAVLLVGGSILLSGLFSEERMLALKVGEREVTQSDFDEYVRLGKEMGLKKREIRDIVVEYEKNLAMVDEYDISMPDEYVKYMAGSSSATGAVASAPEINANDQKQMEEVIAAYQEAAASSESESTPVFSSDENASTQESQINPASRLYYEDNKLTRAMGYNAVFGLRLAQLAYDGYGVFVYDFAANRENANSDTRGSAKKIAEEYRNKIKQGDISPAEAMKEVKAYGVARGHNSFSSVTFVVDEEVQDIDTVASVRSSDFLLKKLKEQPNETGLSEVIETDPNGAFFMYVAFKQQKQDGLWAEVTQAKESTRVVIYDK